MNTLLNGFIVQVKIMLPHDASGKKGPKKLLPDQIQIHEPKAEKKVESPFTISHGEEKKVRALVL